MNLKNQHVLVTGGCSGIDLATTQAMIRAGAEAAHALVNIPGTAAKVAGAVRFYIDLTAIETQPCLGTDRYGSPGNGLTTATNQAKITRGHAHEDSAAARWQKATVAQQACGDQ
jgi:NAD(P)-dependent dehydrogenase (short-subunit alcohol dehydrogenase family)